MQKQLLVLKINGADGRELTASISMEDIQKVGNTKGEEAVKNAIYGVFKQLIEKLRTT